MLSRPEPEYFVIGDLLARFACSRSWIERKLAENNFPKPITFGGPLTARRRWSRASVLAWEAKWREPLL